MYNAHVKNDHLTQMYVTHGFEQDRIMCFDGRRQFVVSAAPCTNCLRRQFVQETTICGARFCKILHKLSPTTICAGTTICGSTRVMRYSTHPLFSNYNYNYNRSGICLCVPRTCRRERFRSSFVPDSIHVVNSRVTRGQSTS